MAFMQPLRHHPDMIHLSVVLDCQDPEALAGFWVEALGYRQAAANADFIGLRDPERKRPTLVLQRVPEPKTVKNRMHLDLFSDRFDADQQRLRELGATVVVDEHVEEDGMRIVTMADPAGNEFCLLEHPGD